MPDWQSLGVGGKMPQTSERKTNCPNKFASGNHLGQSDRSPAIDDNDPTGVLRGSLRKLRDQHPHKPFVTFLQLRELPAETLDLAPLTVGQLCSIKI